MGTSACPQGRKAGFVSERRKFREKTKTVRVPESWNVTKIARKLDGLDALLNLWGETLARNYTRSPLARWRWQKALDMWWEFHDVLNEGRNPSINRAEAESIDQDSVNPSEAA